MAVGACTVSIPVLWRDPASRAPPTVVHILGVHTLRLAPNSAPVRPRSNGAPSGRPTSLSGVCSPRRALRCLARPRTSTLSATTDRLPSLADSLRSARRRACALSLLTTLGHRAVLLGARPVLPSRLGSVPSFRSRSGRTSLSASRARTVSSPHAATATFSAPLAVEVRRVRCGRHLASSSLRCLVRLPVRRLSHSLAARDCSANSSASSAGVTSPINES